MLRHVTNIEIVTEREGWADTRCKCIRIQVANGPVIDTGVLEDRFASPLVGHDFLIAPYTETAVEEIESARAQRIEITKLAPTKCLLAS